MKITVVTMNLLVSSKGRKSSEPPVWPGIEIDIENLRLEELAEAMFQGLGYKIDAAGLCGLFTSEPADIAYRQCILVELAEKPSLRTAFGDALQQIFQLRAKLNKYRHTTVALRKTLLHYYIALDYVKASDLMINALQSEIGLSDRLSDVLDRLKKNRSDSDVDRMIERIASLDTGWLETRSLQMGVNVIDTSNAAVWPHAIIMGEYSKRPYDSSNLFDGDFEGDTGISRLKPIQLANMTLLERLLLADFRRRYKKQIRAFEEVLVYRAEAVVDFCELTISLQFFMGALNLRDRLTKAGYHACLPDIADGAGRFEAEGLYPAGLALDQNIQTVENDADLSGRFFILTGANHSGKTEFLLGVAQAQWLFQLGCYVPASSMKASAVPVIMTMFSSGETQGYDDSRMGLEIRRFHEISSVITPGAMVLLNEPMTSTNPDEGAMICRDMVRTLLEKNATGIMVTHLYELFSILADTQDLESRLGSLVTTTLVDDDGVTTKTYKVVQREPECKSYALELAEKVGLTLGQFVEHAKQVNLPLEMDEEALSKLYHNDYKSI